MHASRYKNGRSSMTWCLEVLCTLLCGVACVFAHRWWGVSSSREPVCPCLIIVVWCTCSFLCLRHQRLWREIKHIMKIAQTVDGIQGSMEKLAEGANAVWGLRCVVVFVTAMVAIVGCEPQGRWYHKVTWAQPLLPLPFRGWCQLLHKSCVSFSCS